MDGCIAGRRGHRATDSSGTKITSTMLCICMRRSSRVGGRNGGEANVERAAARTGVRRDDAYGDDKTGAQHAQPLT